MEASLLANLPQPTTDLPHDTVFQLIVIVTITIFAAIIGSIVSYQFSRKERDRKELSYQVFADTAIVNINTEVEKDKIQILYDGKEAEDINLLVLKIWNSGNTDVKIYAGYPGEIIDNHETPIRFIFERRAVISRSVLETNPPQGVVDPNDLAKYHTTLEPEPDSIGLPACILKPKEMITLRALLKGSQEKFTKKGKLFNGKIVEIASPLPIDLRMSWRMRWTLLLFTICLFLTVFTLAMLAFVFTGNLSLVLIASLMAPGLILYRISRYLFSESSSIANK